MPWVSTLRKPAPLTKAEPAEVRALHRAADAAAPGIRRLFESAFGAAQEALPIGDLREAVTQGNEAQLVALISSVWTTVGEAAIRDALPGLFAEVVAAGAVASIPHTQSLLREVTGIPRLTIGFRQSNPLTLAYIDQFVGTEIRQVSAETIQAVRVAVRRGLEEGVGVASTARQIRQSIGLTERMATTVANYRHGLMQAGESAARITTLVEKRERQLIRRRALNIARTESVTGAAAGQYQLWIGLRDEGLLNSALYRRHWVVAAGERTCQYCTAVPKLNPQGVGLTEFFQTPLGRVLHPTLHPSCRCVISLRSSA